MEKRTVLRVTVLLMAVLLTVLVTGAVLIPVARAETIYVNTTDDEVNGDGDCSLREAVLAANSDTAVDGCSAGSGADVISLPPGSYVLTMAGAGEDNGQTGDLDLTADVTIGGAGLSNTIIDGIGADRVFDVHGGAIATLSGITVQNGNAASGGGVNVSGDLILDDSRVTGNTASGVGGGIFAGGMVTVTRSRIDGNQAGAGGGVYVSFLPVKIDRSEVSGNSVDGGGGGIYSSGTLVVVNSTVSGNDAGGDGGGIYTVESNSNVLYNVTISDNSADANGDDLGDGGGVRVLGGMSFANTLIAGNHDDSSGADVFPDCSGVINSEGYNLIGNVSGCTVAGDNTGNQIGVDPQLGPLQNNGGSTLTHALLAGSPAIDAGNPGGCRDEDDTLLATDQRGFDRPASGSTTCDIGAFEFGSPIPPTPSATPGATPTATAIPPGDEWQYLPAILK